MKKILTEIIALASMLILCSCGSEQTMPYDLSAQTEHFEIYCSGEDTEYYEKLAGELEEYCGKIETALEIEEPQKIKFAVYPDAEPFYAVSGLNESDRASLQSDGGIINTFSVNAGAKEMAPFIYYSSGILPYAIIKSAFDAPEYLLYGAAIIEGKEPFNAEAALDLADGEFSQI